MKMQSDIICGNQALADYLGGISLVTLWRMTKEDHFPKKIKLSKRAVGYKKTEVDEWIKSRQV